MNIKLPIAILLTLALLFATVLPSVAFGDSIHKDYRDEIKEKEQIAKFKERVRREGDTLYLKTRSGKDAIFKDTPEDISTLYIETYQFMKYMPEHDLYFVKIIFYQADGVMMASGKTGERTHIINPPIISPDKKWLFTVPSGEDVTSVNGIFIWRIKDGEFTKVLYHKPREDTVYFQYDFIRWQDNKTIEFSKLTYAPKNLCPDSHMMTVTVIVRLEENKWKIYEAPTLETAKCGSQ
jgi:hypothetical protein